LTQVRATCKKFVRIGLLICVSSRTRCPRDPRLATPTFLFVVSALSKTPKFRNYLDSRALCSHCSYGALPYSIARFHGLIFGYRDSNTNSIRLMISGINSSRTCLDAQGIWLRRAQDFQVRSFRPLVAFQWLIILHFAVHSSRFWLTTELGTANLGEERRTRMEPVTRDFLPCSK
jgi:hypothetical protein